MRFLRTLIQLFFLEFILYVGITGWLSGSQVNCESYCPFGVVATGIPFLRDGTLYCSMTESNLAVLLGVLALTLVAGRAFCSWACPFGTVSEWLAGLGRRLGVSREIPEGRAGKVLLSLKYLLLLVIVAASTMAGDLVFRTYCPYFTLFSFHGHEVQVLSYFVLGNVFLASLVFPLFWCRVLCPLHAFLALVGRLGRLRIRRDCEDCVDCGACSIACPEQIPVDQVACVDDPSCSRCLGCLDACPNGSLALTATPTTPVSPWLVPALVLALLLGSTQFQSSLRTPTLERSYPQASVESPRERAWFVVDGVRCRGTAGALATLIEEGGGLTSLVVYSSGREVIVDYDPAQVAPEELIFRFDREVEIGGQTLHPFTCLRYRSGADGEWQVLVEETPVEVEVKEIAH